MVKRKIRLKKSMIRLRPFGPRRKFMLKCLSKASVLSAAPVVFGCCSSSKSSRNCRVGKKLSLASSNMVTAFHRAAEKDSAWSRKYNITLMPWRASVYGGEISSGHYRVTIEHQIASACEAKNSPKRHETLAGLY